MKEARDRRQSKGTQIPPEEEKSEKPAELKVVIYDEVIEFIENRLQPKARKRILTATNALSNPINRRGSRKIEGRSANDPMFRINIGNYRVFYKWIGGEVHAVEMEHRQGAYGKGKQKGRKQSDRR